MEVRRTADDAWEAVEDGEVCGRAVVWVRPDGRTQLHVADDSTRHARRALLRAVPPVVDGELRTWVRSGAQRLHETLARQGFVPGRREDQLEVDPVRAATWLRQQDAAAVDLRGVQDVGVDVVRVLDEELRQDVPGCDGWHWEPDAFRVEVMGRCHDDALHVVAVDDEEPVGLVRVWDDRDAPRLGLVGVRRQHRGRGIALALLTAVVEELVARGEQVLVTEADPTNAPVARLLAGMGAEVTGTLVEHVRPAGTAA